jgi:hypothetical protein
MQNICVLAGSGTSYGPAKGPSMAELWRSCTTFHDSAPTGTYDTLTTTVAQKIGFDLSQKEPSIESFLSRCEAFLLINDDADVQQVVKRSKAAILQRCQQTSASLSGHELFLQRLSRRRTRDERLKVFTTNYDLCFESAASNLGLVVLDGFSFCRPRRYDPKYFTYDIVRRPRAGEDVGNYLKGVFQLFKLHGSVNWSREKQTENAIDREVVEEVDKPNPSKACLIYPANEKYQQTYIQPHLELFSQYLAALREPNTCFIAVGFGFNDNHLSEPLLSAVKSNPNLRLIICDPAVDVNVSSKGKSKRYWRSFSDIAEKGGDIYFIKADFSTFAELLPDLNALTSAERLTNALRSVMGQGNGHT